MQLLGRCRGEFENCSWQLAILSEVPQLDDRAASHELGFQVPNLAEKPLSPQSYRFGGTGERLRTRLLEALAETTQDVETRSRPAWQALKVMATGTPASRHQAQVICLLLRA